VRIFGFGGKGGERGGGGRIPVCFHLMWRTERIGGHDTRPGSAGKRRKKKKRGVCQLLLKREEKHSLTTHKRRGGGGERGKNASLHSSLPSWG